MQLPLFRIVQECLTNVYKHAETDSASVRLTREQRLIVLEVQDNGVGISRERLESFEAAHFTNGIGLRGMRERIRELGGKFEIFSSGKGTTIRASIPLQATAAGNALSESEAAEQAKGPA
jgi:signal transduction histidine kinase